ncbi:MAG: hypothetical protein ACF8PN_05085 [Phycisphaerales bacterium]
MRYTTLTRHLVLPAGERPAALSAEFTEDDEATILDLSGFTGELGWLRQADGANGTVPAAVDGPAGTVSAELPDAVLDNVGVYELALWAISGDAKYASTWRLVVVPALGVTAPV